MPDFDVLRINFEQLAKVMAARNNTEDFKIHPKAMSRVLEVKHKQNPSNYLIRCFKSMLNVGYTPPKPKNNISQEKIKEILLDIENNRSYYVGASLCVDKVIDDEVLVMNLDGTYTEFGSGKGGDLSMENHKLVLDIYHKHKIMKQCGNKDLYREKMEYFMIKHSDPRS